MRFNCDNSPILYLCFKNFKYNAANMKYFAWLCLLLVSNLSNGQRVLTTFNKVLVSERFDEVSELWEYRNSSRELFLNTDGRYVMKRLTDDAFSVSMLKLEEDLEEYEVIVKFRLGPPVRGRKVHSGGLVVNTGSDGKTASILEFRNTREFRIWKLADGHKEAVHENHEIDWRKCAEFEKKGWNLVLMKFSRGICDVYLNKSYLISFELDDHGAGKPGFFTGPSSDMAVEMFRLSVNSEQYLIDKKRKDEALADATREEGVKQMIQLFRDKISEQSTRIEALQTELAICRARGVNDSTHQAELQDLKDENMRLTDRVGSLQIELESARNRLSYLEALKLQLEQDPNGDIILSLTELLTTERAKSARLDQENQKLREELEQIRKN